MNILTSFRTKFQESLHSLHHQSDLWWSDYTLRFPTDLIRSVVFPDRTLNCQYWLNHCLCLVYQSLAKTQGSFEVGDFPQTEMYIGQESNWSRLNYYCVISYNYDSRIDETCIFVSSCFRDKRIFMRFLGLRKSGA